MRNKLTLLAALAVILASCGNTDDSTGDISAPTTTASVTVTAPESSVTASEVSAAPAGSASDTAGASSDSSENDTSEAMTSAPESEPSAEDTAATTTAAPVTSAASSSAAATSKKTDTTTTTTTSKSSAATTTTTTAPKKSTATTTTQKTTSAAKKPAVLTEEDKRVKEFVDRVTAGKDDKLRACFDSIINDFCYSMQPLPEVKDGWEVQSADNMLVRGYGNCFEFAALFARCGQYLGCDVRTVNGDIKTYRGNVTLHCWTELHKDGKVYVIDPETYYEVVNKWINIHRCDFYMIDYSETPYPMDYHPAQE